MKNKKNLFIKGIALAIALFASVQMNAMETRAQIQQQIRIHQNLINIYKQEIQEFKKNLDPKIPESYQGSRRVAQIMIDRNKETIKNLESEIKTLKTRLR